MRVFTAGRVAPSWVNADNDTVLNAYYADVQNSELLTAEMQRELFQRYQQCAKCSYAYPVGSNLTHCPRCHKQRDFLARDQLIKGFLRYVLTAAKQYAAKFRNGRADSDLFKTLISAGNWGLLIAVNKFDAKKGTRFLTYAAWWIHEKMSDELSNLGLIHIPAHIQKAEQPAVRAVLDSLDTVDTCPSDDDLEQDLVNMYGADVLHAAFDALNFRGRDRYVLLAYFGVREDEKTLRQIAQRLGISSERVRQIKRDALIVLKEHLATRRFTSAGGVLAG